jgi:LPXTG-site transpeptidase (sortase) family protein
MDETNGISNISVLSWRIATDPRLYWELSPNPYAQRALQLISKRFPGVDTADVMRAIIFAEPEGKYDRNFMLLTEEQQKDELLKQQNITAEINKRLILYFKEHRKDLGGLLKEIVYENLLKLIFETDDIKTIEQRFSQDQRKSFKLTIINFIEEVPESVQKELPLNLALVTLFSLLIFFAAQKQNQNIVQNSEPMGTGKQVLAAEIQNQDRGYPTRLIIPSINVDAQIEYVGVMPSGIMEVPVNTIDVAWFDLGPKPGEKGSAVIAGHFDGVFGENAVFANLNKLKEGDRLYVVDNQGVIIPFVVHGNRIYDPGYADDVFGQDDGIHLNLVTCDGVWDGVKKSFSKRLVVFTSIAN